MRKPIVRVQGLNKEFIHVTREKDFSHTTHGGAFGPSDTLKEALSHAARAPLRRFRGARPSGTVAALTDVCFDVEPGEILGIIGPNGAGKSTLLKILARILEPTSGRAELYGRVASLLEIGTGFHPDLTGRENIYLNGAILGMKRREIRSRFDDIVAFAEVDRFLDTPVKRYSSGMFVRLAFAVAAHLDHEVLILDEVLSVGDLRFQEKCIGKFDEITKSGRTILFVSHSLASVTQLCGHAILLMGGEIQRRGTAAEVVEYYRMVSGSGSAPA